MIRNEAAQVRYSTKYYMSISRVENTLKDKIITRVLNKSNVRGQKRNESRGVGEGSI